MTGVVLNHLITRSWRFGISVTLPEGYHTWISIIFGDRRHIRMLAIGHNTPMEFSRVRTLRIVQWQGGRPMRAQCMRCERIFTLDDLAIVTVADARDNLEKQFRSHICRSVGPVRRIA